MPVWIMPGIRSESVTVFFGYGRTMAGRVGNAVEQAQQFNAYLLRTSDAPWFGDGLEIAKTGERYLLATTQEHHLMEGRAPVRVATLEEYTQGSRRSSRTRRTRFPKTLTLYPDHVYDGYKWGMAIDLTTCTGCGACTIACVAENNIPVVGKEQVSQGPRDALDPRRPLLRRRSRQPASRTTSRCPACSARTRPAKWSARSRRRRTARKV